MRAVRTGCDTGRLGRVGAFHILCGVERDAVRVGALLRMRLRSERLPNKALEPIAGRPVLAHILDRMFAARAVREPGDVVVCITDDPSDDPLAPLIEATGARVFRGSEADLIARLHGAVREHGFDVVIQVDGDDVRVDPLYMDLCVLELLLDETLDVAGCEGSRWARQQGAASRRDRARRLAIRSRPQWHRRDALLHPLRGSARSRSSGRSAPSTCTSSARLTLDYPRDLELFRALFAELYRPGECSTSASIVSLLHRRPELRRDQRLALRGVLRPQRLADRV